MYLSLDLGTKMGWALFNEGGLLLVSGTADLDKGNKAKCYAHRFDMLLDLLVELGAQHPIQTVFYEKVMRHQGTHAAHVYGAFEAFVFWHFKHIGVKVLPLGVTEIKKHLTGKGRAPKDVVIAQVNKRYNLSLGAKDDNEADAVAIGDFGISSI